MASRALRAVNDATKVNGEMRCETANEPVACQSRALFAPTVADEPGYARQHAKKKRNEKDSPIRYARDAQDERAHVDLQCEGRLALPRAFGRRRCTLESDLEDLEGFADDLRGVDGQGGVFGA